MQRDGQLRGVGESAVGHGVGEGVGQRLPEQQPGHQGIDGARCVGPAAIGLQAQAAEGARKAAAHDTRCARSAFGSGAHRRYDERRVGVGIMVVRDHVGRYRRGVGGGRGVVLGHRRVVGSGDRDRQGCGRGAAPAVGNGVAEGLDPALAGLQRLNRGVGRVEGVAVAAIVLEHQAAVAAAKRRADDTGRTRGVDQAQYHERAAAVGVGIRSARLAGNRARAIGASETGQHVARRRGLVLAQGVGVGVGERRVVGTGQRDRDGGGVEPALAIGDGVGEGVGCGHARAQRHCARTIGHEAVAAVGIQGQAAVNAGQRHADRAAADSADGQRVRAVRVAVVGQRTAGHTGSVGHQAGGIGLRIRWVVGTLDRDHEVGSRAATLAVADDIGERVDE